MANGSVFPRSDVWTSTDAAFTLISEITASLSVSGCLIIISLYVAFKEIRTTSRMLLVFLSIGDIVLGVATFLQTKSYSISEQLPDQKSPVCQLSAGLYVAAQVCVALWTSAVAAYLFLCVSLRWVTVANRLVFLFHIFCWGMPVVIAIAADLASVYGYNSADVLVQQHPTSCWLSDRVGNLLPWYFITVEGWVLAAFCLICLLYIPVAISVIRARTKGRAITDQDVIEELAQQTANEQLRFIPVIFVCTRLWGSAHFLFTRYPEDVALRASDWLMIFRAFGDNSQGLVNAIFFCLGTKQIRKLLASRLGNICCCFAWCFTCCYGKRAVGGRAWARVPVFRVQRRKSSRTRQLDGSDLDISGISLDLPSPDDNRIDEEDVIFQRNGK